VRDPRRVDHVYIEGDRVERLACARVLSGATEARHLDGGHGLAGRLELVAPRSERLEVRIALAAREEARRPGAAQLPAADRVVIRLLERAAARDGLEQHLAEEDDLLAHVRLERLVFAGHRVVVVDRGNVELIVPEGWVVTPRAEGHLDIRDPTDSCKLEVSYLRLPPLRPGVVPPVSDFLRDVLSKEHGEPPITTESRGSTWIAWAEYAFEELDSERGERRAARGRWLLAANGLFQALLTFYYWADDAPSAVPAWERIAASLALGDGRQLASPREHWGLRRRH